MDIYKTGELQDNILAMIQVYALFLVLYSKIMRLYSILPCSLLTIKIKKTKKLLFEIENFATLTANATQISYLTTVGTYIGTSLTDYN